MLITPEESLLLVKSATDKSQVELSPATKLYVKLLVFEGAGGVNGNVDNGHRAFH